MHPLRYLKGTIQRMYQLANKGVGFNLLSSFAPENHKQTDILQYFDPSEIISFCMSITSQVTLRHDYLPNDFTIMMYK